MTGFDLSTNYVDDPEALLKRTKTKLKKVLALESKDNHTMRSLTLEFKAMANRTLREFSAPTTANIRIESETNVGDNGFELKLALINIVQACQFCGKAYEDASAHLQHFLEICSTFTIKGVTKDTILLCLFSFSLLGKAKQWFYANKDRNTTWANCFTIFLAKFSPTGCIFLSNFIVGLIRTFFALSIKKSFFV
jgi:hypothetical protein